MFKKFKSSTKVITNLTTVGNEGADQNQGIEECIIMLICVIGFFVISSHVSSSLIASDAIARGRDGGRVGIGLSSPHSRSSHRMTNPSRRIYGRSKSSRSGSKSYETNLSHSRSHVPMTSAEKWELFKIFAFIILGSITLITCCFIHKRSKCADDYIPNPMYVRMGMRFLR